jgi:putative ABC transport system ATP-binding protein
MALIIDMNGITKVYRIGSIDVSALKGIDLLVNKGEYVAVMGPSGSGKSTLMNLLGCLDVPTAGTYRLDGELVSQQSDDSLAAVRNRKIGFVFQTFNLLQTETSARNVALPLLYAGEKPEVRNQAAAESLRRVGLGNRLNHRPMELSGGECQRVAIARAIITDPAIILADEPTGNLDSATGTEIMRIFDGLHHQGKTLILVTHDESIAAHAQRIVRIRDGRIAADAQVISEKIRQDKQDFRGSTG